LELENDEVDYDYFKSNVMIQPRRIRANDIKQKKETHVAEILPKKPEKVK
jgi:hypothetical protein